MEPKEYLGLTNETYLTPYSHSFCYDPALGMSGCSITTGTVVSGTTTFNNSINFSTTTANNKIMQSKVAVFKVTRDENNKITDTEFIKELWVKTKNNQSVDFQVARDKDLADYDANDLIIKTIYTVTFQ